jgi:hypothetical protein
VPPFGNLYGLETVLDESLWPDSWMVFEAHTTVEAIRLRTGDFERLERPRRYERVRGTAQGTLAPALPRLP